MLNDTTINSTLFSEQYCMQTDPIHPKAEVCFGYFQHHDFSLQIAQHHICYTDMADLITKRMLRLTTSCGTHIIAVVVAAAAATCHQPISPVVHHASTLL